MTVTSDLFVDVDGVEGPLIVLQADGGSGHGLVVLGADDDDDQVFFLQRGPQHRGLTTALRVSELLSLFLLHFTLETSSLLQKEI